MDSMRHYRIACAALSAATLLAVSAGVAGAAALPGGTLNPKRIAKYVDPLPVPAVMPQTADPALAGLGIDYYEIAVRQFGQQVLSSVDVNGRPLPQTTVWGYGAASDPATFSYPARTIEAQVGRPLRVKWMNQLVDAAGGFLPPLLPVDQTLHWANPRQQCASGMTGTDCRGIDPAPYAGPVPLVTHLHGAHVEPHSDGYPEAWNLPDATDIPAGYATRGSNFGQIPGAPDTPGAALFQYRNDQRATTLWYHDHALGMTRVNVGAGLAGFYLLRGGADDLPAGVPGALPGGAYEVPLVIQDRSFNANGSLFYPASRAFFDGFLGPYVSDPVYPSDISPLHNPEFFGNTVVVNGKTWPFMNVEPRKYRFRILNGSDSRFFVLRMSNKNVPMTQIGADGGFLAAPVVQQRLLVGPAERVDVVVDFSRIAPGATVLMRNVGPDSPFGGFPIARAADPATTGQVMQFRVVPLTAPDASVVPALPAIAPIDTALATVRRVSLNEAESSLVCVDATNTYIPNVTPPTCGGLGLPLAPQSAMLGTVDALGNGVMQPWEAPITETPALGGTEIWEINNFTVDAHPIHLHMVMFQVIDRTDMLTGVTTAAAPGENGFKDTVVALPGQVTRVKAVYDIAGLFVWHCHILSHEDNEMMRPYCVGDPAACAP